MKKKLCLVMSVLLLVSMFAVACKTEEPPELLPDEPLVEEGRGDVVISINGDISSFDPFHQMLDADIIVYRQIYDTLLYLTPDRSIEPRLAESYTVNDDSTVFTFKLRDDVKFHNGEMLQASDVVFSLNHYMESPFLSAFVGGIADVQDAGDNTVVVTMHEPNAPFLAYAAEIISIVSEKAITEGGENYDDAPVGTGPYKYVSYARANQIVFTRNEDYYRGVPPIKDLTLRVMPNPSTSVIALRAGDIDFSIVMAADYATVSNDSSFNMGVYPSLIAEYAILNHAADTFDDVRVRQAINYAIDREFILESTAEGLGRVAKNMLPPGVLGYSPAIDIDYDYNPEAASSLLTQAGISIPFDIGKIITIEPFALTSQIVLQNLEAVGLTGTIDVMEFTRFNESLMTGDFAIACVQLGLTSDPDSYSNLLTPENIGGMNFAGYDNPKMTELFDKGRATADIDERVEIYNELFIIAGQDAAYATLFFPESHYAWNKDLKAPHNVSFHVYDMSW